MIETHTADCLLKKGMIVLFIIISIILMVVVGYQQTQIHILDDRAFAHDEFIKFMQQGDRFTYTDGKALFLIMTDDRTVSEKTKQDVWTLYKDGETSFSTWLRAQDVCQTKL